MQHLAGRSRLVTWLSRLRSTSFCPLMGGCSAFRSDVESLEDRPHHYLLKVVDRADARRWLQPRVAQSPGSGGLGSPRRQALGIDTSRALTQGELAHLLAGARADGLAIEGKQVQKPMKSVADVFGLTDRQMPTPEQIDHVIAGRRVDGDAQVGDTPPAARQRFLTAYGLPAGTELTAEHVANMQGWQVGHGQVPGPRRRAAEARARPRRPSATST